MDTLITEYIENFLYLDIETLPSGERLTVEEMSEKAPKNYSKPETINKWAEKQIEEEYRKRALESERGRLYCIAYAMNDEPIRVISYNEDEKVMMEEFVTDLKKSYDRTLATCGWVGQNIGEFDIPWLYQRMIKYQIKDIIYYLPDSPFHKRLIDTGREWTRTQKRGYVSLDTICRFLGIEGKGDVDGSKVYDLFLAGEHEKTYKYCASDVDKVRQIWNLIR